MVKAVDYPCASVFALRQAQLEAGEADDLALYR